MDLHEKRLQRYCFFMEFTNQKCFLLFPITFFPILLFLHPVGECKESVSLSSARVVFAVCQHLHHYFSLHQSLTMSNHGKTQPDIVFSDCKITASAADEQKIRCTITYRQTAVNELNGK